MQVYADLHYITNIININNIQVFKFNLLLRYLVSGLGR